MYLDCHQPVDGYALRVLWQGGKLVDEANPVLSTLPQPYDASGTHTDAGLSHVRERLQPVTVFAGGGHLHWQPGEGLERAHDEKKGEKAQAAD